MMVAMTASAQVIGFGNLNCKSLINNMYPQNRIENGFAVCTEKFCIRTNEKLMAKREVQKPHQCTPGTRWNDGCNNCFCAGNGE